MGLAIRCSTAPNTLQTRLSGASSRGFETVAARNTAEPPSSKIAALPCRQSVHIPKMKSAPESVKPKVRFDGSRVESSARRDSCQPSVDTTISRLGLRNDRSRLYTTREQA